ncbi:MAG TPA: DUF2924 domain-containing protein [Stellaceae bacterium]|nr:DUF2924 domain-containing protein [Stellaceae bacterium]
MIGAPQYNEARQETGGPSRSNDLRGQPGETDIKARLIGLEALSTTDLRIEWRRLYRATPPTRLSRDLLIRGVAYRVQENADGGFSPTIRRMLRSRSAGSDHRGGPAVSPAVILKPGTKLVREWHGRAHTVSVLDEGFEYQGKHYRSLTRVARHITGVHWSGPLFFGISKRRRAVEAGADE